MFIKLITKVLRQNLQKFQQKCYQHVYTKHKYLTLIKTIISKNFNNKTTISTNFLY